MVLWPIIAVAAAGAQTGRTALQKRLTSSLSAMSVAWVRFLFGLPFAMVWLAIWIIAEERDIGTIGVEIGQVSFLSSAFVAAIAQLTATWLLVYSFRLRNFAVTTSYARTEAVQAAILGSLFFSHQINPWAWVGVTISLVGAVMIGAARQSAAGSFDRKTTLVGLSSGCFFALSSLHISQASKALGDPSPALSASVTLVVVLIIQILALIGLVVAERGQISGIFRLWKTGILVGIMSAAGSIGWFTALSLALPVYVKAVGQIEFVFAVLVSIFIFHEHPNRMELLGMGALLAGIITLLLGVI